MGMILCGTGKKAGPGGFWVFFLFIYLYFLFCLTLKLQIFIMLCSS